MMKRFPVLIIIFILLIMFSFVVAAENTESESVFFEESSSFSYETTSEEVSEIFTETTTEEISEPSTVSSGPGDQATIINRLDLIYTLGLFVVGIFAALLVIFILWRVLDVFI